MSLSKAINYFATLNEENVTLVQVGGGKAKVYRFDDIYNAISGREYKVEIKTGASGLPTILINSGRDSLIQFRVKQEFKRDGKPICKELY